MGRSFGSDIAFALLNAIADGIEICERGVYQPTALMRYGLDNLKTMEAERARLRIRNVMYRMERKKLIERRKQDNDRAFRLTALGEELRLQRQPKQKLSNGYQIIVSFDIPEQQKHARQAFRNFLRRLGFSRAHLSVWTSYEDWSVELTKHIVKANIGSWVVVFRGECLYTHLQGK